MATLEVLRSRAGFARRRELKVWVEGAHVVSLRSGETRAFRVPDALLEIRVSMDWCASRPVVVDASGGGLHALEVRTAPWPACLLLVVLRPSAVFSLSSVLPRGDAASASPPERSPAARTRFRRR